MQILRYKVRTYYDHISIFNFLSCARKLVDSEDFTPEAITEIGHWKSVDSHRNYYKVSTKIRVKSARIISSIL